jgi:hypothetical protein
MNLLLMEYGRFTLKKKSTNPTKGNEQIDKMI